MLKKFFFTPNFNLDLLCFTTPFSSSFLLKQTRSFMSFLVFYTFYQMPYLNNAWLQSIWSSTEASLDDSCLPFDTLTSIQNLIWTVKNKVVLPPNVNIQMVKPKFCFVFKIDSFVLLLFVFKSFSDLLPGGCCEQLFWSETLLQIQTDTFISFSFE